ncbi:helix-hairpin-helix domain-containing protein [Alloacidobacterium sp.]|uniref:ComEA family DNA-binding protein n=1 Tax=Alloacidobacterium sp. TaxID=2951999 RepID=UPI002D39BDA6|nr:helix-hairpin-helix domain-containing protein [Alloacidobacterium sp.]HYK38091.1 helix-hairpin-helix domain-containing protein [Alloacidobacterium sp.]
MKFHRAKNVSDLAIRLAVAMCLFAASLWLAACARKQSDEQLKQQAAQATQQAKQGAQQAAADAKVAAATAERKVNDIAAGVKEGLKSNSKPGAGTVDINSASEQQLVDLPGITGARAQRIIRNRPYSHPHDLVAKGVLTEQQYGRISGQITAD